MAAGGAGGAAAEGEEEELVQVRAAMPDAYEDALSYPLGIWLTLLFPYGSPDEETQECLCRSLEAQTGEKAGQM